MKNRTPDGDDEDLFQESPDLEWEEVPPETGPPLGEDLLQESPGLEWEDVPAPPPRRPKIITLLCLCFFVSLPALFSDLRDRSQAILVTGDYLLAAWIPASTAFVLFCLLGLWKMRQWSVILYTAGFVFNQSLLIHLDWWTPKSLIGPSIFLAIGWSYYSRMD